MISKLIIPAAGIGSRFLPITKAVPKEMLPLSNKPAIEYIVQEGADAGLCNTTIILSPEKEVIKEYFKKNEHLEKILKKNNKMHYIQPLLDLLGKVDLSYRYQYSPKGLAHALMQAQDCIDEGEFFGVALPDDIILGDQPEIKELAQLAIQYNAMVIAVQPIANEHISSYGIMAPKNQLDESTYEVAHLVEKPPQADAPSNLAIVGRYIFSSDIFTYIPQTPHTSEILLPETINLMIQQGYKVIAHTISGKRFDTGTPQGWLNYILHDAQNL